MTDVEEALEIMTDMELSHCAVDCGDDIEQVDIFDIVDQDKWEKIKSNLQRAAECEKVIDQYAETIRMQTENGNSLKRKAQGLVKALEIILDRYQTMMDKFNHGELYYREDVWKAKKAITAFKAGEIEGCG